MNDLIEPIAPQEETPETPAPTEVADQAADLNRMKMEGFFGVQNPNGQESQYISELSRMLGVGQRDIVDVLWDIKQTEHRIGTPPLGMSRLQHLYNYIKINSQITSLEKERDLYAN